MSLWHALENVTRAHWDIEVSENDRGEEVAGTATSPNGQYEWRVEKWTNRGNVLWKVEGWARDPRTGMMERVMDFREASRHDAVSRVGAFTPDLVGRSAEEPPDPGLFDQLG